MKLKRFSLLGTVMLITILALSTVTFAGCGEYKSAVHISTPEDLLLMADGGSFVLDNDIDCGGMTLNVIEVNEEAGLDLDGKGHVIKNVKLGGNNNMTGLIYCKGMVTITDLGIVDFTINSDYQSSNGQSFSGAFVPLCNDTAKLTRCYAKGKIDVNVKNSKTYMGGLVGFCPDCNFTDCLSDVELNAELNDVKFEKATVYGGGLVGYTGRNGYYPGTYYGTPFKHCISLSSISVDTVLSVSLNTQAVLGGLAGMVLCPQATECISAPKYMRVSTFILKNGVIGGLVGKAELNKSTGSYYCNYYDEQVPDEERDTLCSYYDKLNGSGEGLAINREKPLFFTEEFLTTDATFTDKSGKIVDTFLRFDKSVWNFGNGVNTLPSLKCFDNN